MADKNDHDLIVELSTKMTQLCRTTEKHYNENIKTHDKILEKIDDNLELTDKWVSGVHDRIDAQLKEKTGQVAECHKTFLQSKTFYWVVGFIIAGVISVWGFAAMVYDKAEKTEDKIIEYHPEERPQVPVSKYDK